MTEICSYEYDRETKDVKVNCLNCIYGASVEDFDVCMARTIDKLMEVKKASNIILTQTREFEYDYGQAKMLIEIARIITTLLQETKILSANRLAPTDTSRSLPKRMAFVQKIVTSDLRRDPIGAYVEVVREIRRIKVVMMHMTTTEQASANHYIAYALNPLRKLLESTTLIKMAQPHLTAHHVGSRDIYREIFHPIIRPNFMLTRYMMIPPTGGSEIDRYKVSDTDVQIYKVPNQVQYYYHILPPEFTLSEEEYTLLDVARQYMSEHKPTRSEFAQPERMREVFYNIGHDMLAEIADNIGVSLSRKKLDLLARILTRYTAGYGILEVILTDSNVQDIFLNAPVGNAPLYLFHGNYEECITNVIPTKNDAEAWTTRLRIESGRPLDEANPVLDTEIDVPGGRARVAVITKSLSPDGLAFAFRRHRDRPWTYPLFVKAKAMNPLAAGLMSFIIDGARTILFAGTRSSGKSSLLGATLTEIMRRFRILTVEDTLELPVEQIRELGYNIERLKAQSVITHIESELSAAEAIRTSLRLGDSCLFIGEVRSTEARALYESMRIGALANVVAGTIHGDSPYGVFDRVVNDLEVPPTSFKATDIIVMANRLRSADGLHTFRRVLSITEVRKDWTEDPVKEKAFVDLMEYDSKKDQLVPTDTFLNGESYILNDIAKRVKDWNNNWEAVWENIQLRSKVKETLVETAKRMGNTQLLEASFTVIANNKFHILSEKVKEEYGALDSDRIFARWNEWLRKEAKDMANVQIQRTI
ncbi:MAG: CpaF family protein [Candidatus Aenigmarchaeota archaeon]|nr:CpaF family protein [Candidatus Aenigmarchaeota archaeon]